MAFIGSGGIANRHAKALLSHPDKFQALGACDIHLPSAQKFLSHFGENLPAFDTQEALYAQLQDQLDAVIICTPHFLHFPAAHYFLERGVPALIEKPVLCSLFEWQMIRALETETAFVQAGQMQRFDPEAAWLKDFVRDEARFGTPVSFDLNIWQNIQGFTVGKEDHWILSGEKAGGGIVASVGIHPLDIIRYMTGQDFTEVTAHGRFDPPFHHGAESSCSASLR